jgi:hypothetical protein
MLLLFKYIDEKKLKVFVKLALLQEFGHTKLTRQKLLVVFF